MNREIFHNKVFNEIWLEYKQPELEEAMNRIETRILSNNIDLKNKKCIDLGCGIGRFSFVMSKLGASKVIGIDQSENNISYAKMINMPNTEFHVGNIYNIQYPDNSFDFAVTNGVLHHVDIKKAVKEIYRILKPNGKLWIYIDTDYPTIRRFIKFIFQLIPYRLTLNFLKLIKTQPNKIMHYMDICYAYYYKYPKEMVYKVLDEVGFGKLTHLKKTKYDLKKQFRVIVTKL